METLSRFPSLQVLDLCATVDFLCEDPPYNGPKLVFYDDVDDHHFINAELRHGHHQYFYTDPQKHATQILAEQCPHLNQVYWSTSVPGAYDVWIWHIARDDFGQLADVNCNGFGQRALTTRETYHVMRPLVSVGEPLRASAFNPASDTSPEPVP